MDKLVKRQAFYRGFDGSPTPARRQGRHVIADVETFLGAVGSSLDRVVGLRAFVSGGDDHFTDVRQVLEASLEDDMPGTLSGNEALHGPGCLLSLDGVARVELERTGLA